MFSFRSLGNYPRHDELGEPIAPTCPPRLPKEQAPRIPKGGAIPDDADSMPDEINYDETKQRLLVGKGYIDQVPAAVWHYEVSGKRVLTQ